jgi:hypothetical protein
VATNSCLRLEIVRGDNPLIELTFTDASGVALDITDLVLRSAMKRRLTDEATLWEATSYPVVGRISKTTPLGGIAVMSPLVEDTHSLPIGDVHCDVETTAADALVGTGTAALVNGSETITLGGGLTNADAKVGDVLIVTSANPANASRFVLDVTALGVPYVNGYSRWTDETATVALHRGHRETPIRFILEVGADARR